MIVEIGRKITDVNFLMFWMRKRSPFLKRKSIGLFKMSVLRFAMIRLL